MKSREDDDKKREKVKTIIQKKTMKKSNRLQIQKEKTITKHTQNINKKERRRKLAKN